ncbi:TPA: hypothetical protein N0F65_011689, partial [Lagenidium giganteum]
RSTVCRGLRRTKIAKYIKTKPASVLNPEQKVRRVAFATEKVTCYFDWERLLFSDEKKFNLEDASTIGMTPDGRPIVFSKRVGGGGCVMVSAAMSARGTIEIKFWKADGMPSSTTKRSRLLAPVYRH